MAARQPLLVDACKIFKDTTRDFNIIYYIYYIFFGFQHVSLKSQGLRERFAPPTAPCTA